MTDGLERILTNWNATPLTHENAPGLVSSLEKLAEKASLPKIKAYLVDAIPGFGSFGKINAAAISKDTIIFTKGLLESYNCADMNSPADTRLEAVIGHELSHCRQHGLQVSARLIPPLLLPLVAAIGYHYYQKAKDHKTAEETHAALDQQAELTHQEVEKENNAPAQAWQKKIITAAKYTAAVALGLGAGLLITRGFSNHFEYKADDFSKELLGSATPLVEALKKIEADIKNLVAKEGDGRSVLKKILSKTLHAHPSIQSRTERLLR